MELLVVMRIIALIVALVFTSNMQVDNKYKMASAATPVTFVFGDSLTEVGNNNYLQYSLAKSNYPWYGVDYDGGRATGRFTNGRTIGDIICISSKNNHICYSCLHSFSFFFLFLISLSSPQFSH